VIFIAGTFFYLCHMNYEQIKNLINTIQHPTAFLEFAKKYLEPTAKAGSSRIVYDIGKNRALKIAFNEAGIDQNKVEYSYGTSPTYSRYIPESLSKNPNYFWIEVEKADLIKDEDEHLAINFLIDIYDMFNRTFTSNDLSKIAKEQVRRNRVPWGNLPRDYQTVEDVIFKTNFVDMANFVAGNLGLNDLHATNIGKINGKYKFIDPGFSDDVKRKYADPGYRSVYKFKEDGKFVNMAQKAADQKQTIVREQRNKNLSFDEVKKIMKSIKNPRSMMAFLKRFGDNIGVGSSRAAFDIGNGRVLKIAFNEAGRWQNLNELKIMEKLDPYIPEIYEYHPDGFWIEMERAANHNDAIFYPKMIEFINLPNEIDTIQDIKAIFYYLAPLAARLKSNNPEDYKNLILDTVVQKMVRPFLKRADFFLPFLSKLKETGTGDTNHKNMGFSLKKNTPVILDFGFASNAEKDLKSIYKRRVQVGEDELPEFFGTENYFSDIESDNLKYQLSRDPSFVSEQNRNPYSRKDKLDIGAEELKKIINSFGTVSGLTQFISKFFPKAGKGSSRCVFDLGDGSVLKIAMNEAGIAQNKDEVDIHRKINDPNVVAQIYDYDKNGMKWIQMEKLIPASKLATDSIYREIFRRIRTVIQLNDVKEYMKSDEEYITSKIKSIKDIEKTNLAEIFIEYVKSGGHPVDFALDNVGYNVKQNKFKVIDAGYGENLNSIDFLSAIDRIFSLKKEIEDNIQSKKQNESYYDNIGATQLLNELHGSIVDRVMRTMKDPSISFEDKRKWLEDNFENIGSGVERTAYALDDDYVIKVSNEYHEDMFDDGSPIHGIQSFFEANPEMHAFFGDLVPRIYDFDRKDGNWILAERGVPIPDFRSEKKWMASVGIPTEVVQKIDLSHLGEILQDLHDLLSSGYDINMAIQDIEYDTDIDVEIIKQMLQTPFILKMYDAHSRFGIGLEDFGYGNIGYGLDGRPVILDVGYEA
jgi:hypothetical protein